MMATPIPLIKTCDHPNLIRLLDEDLCRGLSEKDADFKAMADLHRFSGQKEAFMIRLRSDGTCEAFFGLGKSPNHVMALRALPSFLPPGDWAISEPHPWPLSDMATAFALGSYSFDRYLQVSSEKTPKDQPRLLVTEGYEQALAIAQSFAKARDLINTPARDCGPKDIEKAVRDLAQAYHARLDVICGEALLTQNYPAIHVVGAGASSERSPRLIRLDWETGLEDKTRDKLKSKPLIALIGKGVSFDTGGLDLKPSQAMRLMKKDMGGTAHALALGELIMRHNLPVRLMILIPAVENSISATAMRPGDVIGTRKGLSVEIGNTDAEGRLILADALTRAFEDQPDLVIDFATLTGAARIALGPDIVPFYTNDESLSRHLIQVSQEVQDPLWPMPLWEGYESALDSDIADLKNEADDWAKAGSITAALFLKAFVSKGQWIHLDIFAWNGRRRRGYPQGAEIQAVRALFALISQRSFERKYGAE